MLLRPSQVFPMAGPATITIRIPTVLRSDCGGASELSLSAANVRGALAEVERSHPVLYGRICDETGAVRRHVNVFVNKSHMREQAGLDTVLESGDVVTILPAVSGG
jgi:molybdopterin converting factor small subunit